MGDTQRAAESNLREVLSDHIEQSTGAGELTVSRSLRQLVEVSLEDLDLEKKPAEVTRALHERSTRQFVLPAFENDDAPLVAAQCFKGDLLHRHVTGRAGLPERPVHAP